MITMEDLNTEFQYVTEINSIAADLVQRAMDENDNDREQAEEAINDRMLHEDIDGHQWVIYYAYNMPVIQYSDNAEYMVDNFGGEAVEAAVKDGGMSGLHTAVAFWAMYADVQDRLDQAFDEFQDDQESDES